MTAARSLASRASLADLMNVGEGQLPIRDDRLNLTLSGLLGIALPQGMAMYLYICLFDNLVATQFTSRQFSINQHV